MEGEEFEEDMVEVELEGEEGEDSDEPITRCCVLQEDLNNLYSGRLAKVFYLYAWFFTNAFIYYTYSAGIPAMYGIGALHFCLSYLCYKFLFIKYYQVIYGFDEQIIRHSILLMKWSLFFHLLMALFMFTNKRLLTPSDYSPAEHYRPPLEAATDFFRRRYSSENN